MTETGEQNPLQDPLGGQPQQVGAMGQVLAGQQAAAGNQQQMPQPVPPQNQGVAQGAGAFSKSPYSIQLIRYLDYLTLEGIKTYNRGTYKLTKNGYDCDPDGLQDFLKFVKDRAKEFGQLNSNNGILMIPKTTNGVTVYINLVKEYGTVDIDKLKAYKENYIDTQRRQSQLPICSAIF